MKTKAMKVKYLMLTLAGVYALSASAQQENMPRMGQTPAKNTAYARSEAGDNWFVTLQGGAAMQFGKGNEDADFFDRQTVAPTFAVGKWHNPFFGTRLQMGLGVSHDFSNNEAKSKLEMNHARYANAHFDFMFDVINYFKPYSEDRVFHLIPWVGFGYDHKFEKNSNFKVDALTANAGLMFAFRVMERMDIVLESQVMYSDFNLNTALPEPRYTACSGMLTAGLNFRIGNIGWSEILPMDWGLVNDLNGQINAMRAKNAELSKRPVSCPECPEVEPRVERINMLSDKSVLFRAGKTTVDSDQMVTIFDVAQFAKKNGTQITVTGYADKKGKESDRTSELRAKAVAKILTDKYGVPSDRISIEWKGVSEQVYDNRDWNRVVILRSK